MLAFQPGSPPPANPFWLNAVQILCACTLLAILMFLLMGQSGSVGWSILWVPLFFSPLWSPFAWILWRLSSDPDDFILRRALILAASWALLILVLTSIILFALLDDRSDTLWAVFAGAIGSLQILLILSSAKCYFFLPHDRDDLRLLIPRLGSALVVVASALFLSVYALAPNRPAGEASAVGSLRTIHSAQLQFAQDHPQAGFATSLAQLGPSSGADLIDHSLASGTKSGYIFLIAPATTDPPGRVTKYLAIARPVHYGQTGTRSFLVDESGTLHYTRENRTPTVQDPLLQ